MNNVTLPQSYLPVLNQSDGLQNQPASRSSESGDFRSLISDMLMTSVSGSMMGGGQSMGGGMMAALMLIPMIEKLLALEINSENGPDGTVETDSPWRSSPTPYGKPVEGGRLTWDFHPGHNGLDFGVPVGTPVHSTMDGEVVYAEWNNQGYGNLVIVENGPFRTYYAHLSEIPVQRGQRVSAGNVIGLSGNTGNSTGPHLHYEVRENGTIIDPTSFTLNTP